MFLDDLFKVYYSPDGEGDGEGNGETTEPVDNGETGGVGDVTGTVGDNDLEDARNDAGRRVDRNGRIIWDDAGERIYETGVDHGVLYPKNLPANEITSANGGYAAGVPWNGLTAVNQNPSGGEPNPLWADNIKYLNLVSNEEFGGTIEAYTYPDEFAQCDGSKSPISGFNVGQQRRVEFGFTYRTKVGNDVEGADYGYKLHIVYGCLASPSGKQYQTVNETPDAINFSWEFTTTPIELSGDLSAFRPTAHIELDSTKLTSAQMTAIEDILYGHTVSGIGGGASGTIASPRLPMPNEVYTILMSNA